MLKALALGVPLSLVSLSAMALPDTVDISGIELGSNIEDAAEELKERIPDGKITEKEFPNGSGLGYFFIRDKEMTERWWLLALPDGTGRLIKIGREQSFEDQNVGMEATVDALRKKYGKESPSESSMDDRYYWAEKTDGAPDDFEITDAKDAYQGAVQLFDGRFNPADSENLKVVMSANLNEKYKDEALLDKLTVYAYWVEPTREQTLNHIAEQKRKKEAEQQRKLKEAESNAADL